MRTFLQVVNQLFYPGLIIYHFILPLQLNMYKKVPKTGLSKFLNKIYKIYICLDFRQIKQNVIKYFLSVEKKIAKPNLFFENKIF